MLVNYITCGCFQCARYHSATRVTVWIAVWIHKLRARAACVAVTRRTSSVTASVWRRFCWTEAVRRTVTSVWMITLSHACATSRNQCKNKIKTVVACTDRNVLDWTNKHCDRLDVVEMLASHSPIKRFTLCRRKNERPIKARRCQEVSYEPAHAPRENSRSRSKAGHLRWSSISREIKVVIWSERGDAIQIEEWVDPGDTRIVITHTQRATPDRRKVCRIQMRKSDNVKGD